MEFVFKSFPWLLLTFWFKKNYYLWLILTNLVITIQKYILICCLIQLFFLLVGGGILFFYIFFRENFFYFYLCLDFTYSFLFHLFIWFASIYYIFPCLVSFSTFHFSFSISSFVVVLFAFILFQSLFVYFSPFLLSHQFSLFLKISFLDFSWPNLIPIY